MYILSMIDTTKFQSKIQNWQDAVKQIRFWQDSDLKVVFTNGCFDILHAGHIHYLNEAKQSGDKLVIGLNSDTSVTRLKGQGRPVQNESDRAIILSALEMVDLVVLFSDDTPLELLAELKPDVLVKGGDYTLDTIVGAKEVIARGGVVHVLSFVDGKSTTNIISRLS